MSCFTVMGESDLASSVSAVSPSTEMQIASAIEHFINPMGTTGVRIKLKY